VERPVNIVETIRAETAGLSARVAIVEEGRSITYGQLLSRVDALADRLASFGAGQGKRIAFRCADGIDYVVGALALLKTVAAVVPVAESMTDAEVDETVERIDVHAIYEYPDDRWTSRDARGECDDACRQLGAAFIRFSSGTTGQSKGVVLSHATILDRTAAANDGLRVTSEDVILWVLGMSHHFVVSILLFLRRGATIVVAGKAFPFSLFEAIAKHSVTLVYASPVHHYVLAMSSAVAPDALKHVRLSISTSMKMPVETARQFFEKFGITPAEAYGVIEIGLPFVGDGTPGSVGRALPAYEVRIDRPDPNGVGDVIVRGKGMFDAYFSPWQSRDDVAPDGWFSTGDVGRLDEAGRLYLLGRTKTVIVTAGMKVFPEEVEEVINACPGIAESLVWGREHPQFGQVPVAHVVSRDLPGDLRGQCLKRLSSYKVPVEFVRVERLARTPSGKLARAVTPLATS
jgi:long-chain acyl-CoA synthetase